MTTILFFDTDDDLYAAEEMGIPWSRLRRDPFSGQSESPENDAVVITDRDCPEAVEQAHLAAAFLSGLFASVRVLALPGGLVGWIERGGDARSL